MIESQVIPHKPEPKPGETRPGPEIQIIPPKPLTPSTDTLPEARPIEPITKDE